MKGKQGFHGYIQRDANRPDGAAFYGLLNECIGGVKGGCSGFQPVRVDIEGLVKFHWEAVIQACAVTQKEPIRKVWRAHQNRAWSLDEAMAAIQLEEDNVTVEGDTDANNNADTTLVPPPHQQPAGAAMGVHPPPPTATANDSHGGDACGPTSGGLTVGPDQTGYQKEGQALQDIHSVERGVHRQPGCLQKVP